jgi:hypothetical protein
MQLITESTSSHSLENLTAVQFRYYYYYYYYYYYHHHHHHHHYYYYYYYFKQSGKALNRQLFSFFAIFIELNNKTDNLHDDKRNKEPCVIFDSNIL